MRESSLAHRAVALVALGLVNSASAWAQEPEHGYAALPDDRVLGAPATPADGEAIAWGDWLIAHQMIMDARR